jgi:hypothetical protein
MKYAQLCAQSRKTVPWLQSDWRYSGCNLFGFHSVDMEEAVTTCAEPMVFSCDYNGWADVPEEQREALDVFEATLRSDLTPRIFPVLPSVGPVLPPVPQRRAA